MEVQQPAIELKINVIEVQQPRIDLSLNVLDVQPAIDLKVNVMELQAPSIALNLNVVEVCQAVTWYSRVQKVIQNQLPSTCSLLHADLRCSVSNAAGHGPMHG